MTAERQTSAPRTLRQFCVYVIGLGAFPASDDRPTVYVGSTGKTVDERYRDHRAGGRTASPKVTAYETGLLPELYQEVPTYATRDEAETAERALRLALELAGYRVFGASGRAMPSSRAAWHAADPRRQPTGQSSGRAFQPTVVSRSK